MFFKSCYLIIYFFSFELVFYILSYFGNHEDKLLLVVSYMKYSSITSSILVSTSLHPCPLFFPYPGPVVSFLVKVVLSFCGLLAFDIFYNDSLIPTFERGHLCVCLSSDFSYSLCIIQFHPCNRKFCFNFSYSKVIFQSVDIP